MLRVWVHGCDPGRVSDGSRLALYAKLSLSSALLLSFSDVCFVLLFLSFCRFCFVFMLSLELCRCSPGISLSGRPRTGLATMYFVYYWVWLRPDRLM